jgi:protein disulfide-isomerase A6
MDESSMPLHSTNRLRIIQAMAPAWAELGTAYEGSSSVLIGDVDCTVHASTCSKFDVSGYPTIKYFKDGDKKGESFNSGRDLESLKSWVADNLEIKCQVADTKGCSDKEIKFIDTMKEKSGEDRKKELARLDGMKTGSMKPELKQWLVARQNILKQLE